MKKYFLLILIPLFVLSCSQDADKKGIEKSFKQLLNSLETEDLKQTGKFIPFLVNLTEEEQNTVLKPFRSLNSTTYELEISKNSDDIYKVQIITKDSDPFWFGITIPYKQSSEGKWVMTSVIKSVQTFDIIPAKN